MALICSFISPQKLFYEFHILPRRVHFSLFHHLTRIKSYAHNKYSFTCQWSWSEICPIIYNICTLLLLGNCLFISYCFGINMIMMNCGIHAEQRFRFHFLFRLFNSWRSYIECKWNPALFTFFVIIWLMKRKNLFLTRHPFFRLLFKSHRANYTAWNI